MDKQQRIAVFLKGSDAGMVIQNYQENPDLFPPPTAEELAAFDEWQKQQATV